MLLAGKNAVIYGAAGAVGSVVARTFAREGARLFLSGKDHSNVKQLANALGDQAEAAEVNALDEQQISRHLNEVVGKAGQIDISFNAIGIRNTKLQGVPLTEINLENFNAPIASYTQSVFLTSRAAARHMINQKSGSILCVTSSPARSGIPMMGGVGPAMSAVESLLRGFSAELAPHGIRVVGLRPLGMPDSATIDEVYGLHAKAWRVTPENFADLISGRTHAKRLPRLQEMANAAAFAASDLASAFTGTILNMSLGSLDD